MDSDQASELILASKLIKEGGILSKTWYYSTSLRIFDVQLFFMLGLIIFPTNFIYAKIFGILLMLLLMSLSFYMLAKQIVDEKLAIIFSGLIILPYSFWQEFHIVMSGAYIPYVILVNTGLAIVVSLYKKKNVLLVILSSIIAFVAGLAGVRMGMVLYAPLFIAMILSFILYKKQILFYLPSFLSYFAAFLINKFYLAKHYYFQDTAKLTLNQIDFNLVLSTLYDYTVDFGYYFITFIIFIVAIIYLIIKYKNFNFEKKFIFIYFLAALFIQIMSLILFWTGNGSYFLTLMPISLLMIAIFIDNINYKTIVTLVTMLSIILSSIYFSINAIKSPLRGNYELKNVVEKIKKDPRLKNGVARFWDSNVVTAWANGEIEMWTVDSSDTLNTYRWLQSTTHNIPPSDFFMIVDKNEVDINQRDAYLTHLTNKYDKKPIIESENYWVLY